jgi:osmotically-inducible protein OsmY
MLTLAACAVLVLGLGACSSTQSASTQIDDAALTSAVKAKLTADPEINPFNIDVDTDEGVVRLSGKVEKAAARSEAERLARNTEGVRRVINDIDVGKTTVGERVAHSGLASKVKAKIAADPELNPFNIDVDASGDGVITLTGRVATQAAREEAGMLASRTEGVRHVHNRLEVGDVDMGGE